MGEGERFTHTHTGSFKCEFPGFGSKHEKIKVHAGWNTGGAWRRLVGRYRGVWAATGL